MNIIAAIHWDVSPEIVSLGFIHIRWYGLLFALGFVAGYQILAKMFAIEAKPQKDLESLTITMIIAVVLGARLGHCLFYAPDFYLSNPEEILKIWEGGLASHGGAIGMFIGVYLFLRKRKHISFLWLTDRISIVVALAACFVRLGNLFNSEIYGVQADVPWAFVFERIDNVPRHPSQLYEAISYFLIFIFLIVRYVKYKSALVPGKTFALLLTLLFSARFLIEFTKAKQAAFDIPIPLSMGQILSLPLIILGLYLLIRAGKFKSQQT